MLYWRLEGNNVRYGMGQFISVMNCHGLGHSNELGLLYGVCQIACERCRQRVMVGLLVRDNFPYGLEYI